MQAKATDQPTEISAAYNGLSLVGTPWIRSMSGWTVIFFISSGSVTVILPHRKQNNRGEAKTEESP